MIEVAVMIRGGSDGKSGGNDRVAVMIRGGGDGKSGGNDRVARNE